ncbi:MAG: energy transducer TonB [Succiniclasticum sp.]|jgi:protein TonB|nr:energy transducer TonB [Succiniclasticum sp.]MEE3479265.1 energy transducer TonB [Succiniclasticum sp.]
MINEDGKKGLAVSLVFHIFCFALVGAVALYSYHTPAKETIYDVALMSGGGDAAPLEDQAEPEEPDEDEEEEEEEVQPAPDDITEERTVVRREHHKSHKKSQSSVHRAAGGTGSGTSDGLGSGGSGGGEGAGVGPASDSIQAPAVAPRVTRSRSPEYPSSARNNGIEGTAVVRFLIGKDGGVEDLTLARSSGNGSLDQAALNAARGFRFRPGLDGYGRPVRCYAYQPFAFRLR